MLIDGADNLCRELLDELFTSTSEAEMEAGFAALAAELNYRRSLHDEQDRKHRRETGAPERHRRVGPDVLEAALAEWETLIAEPPPADQDDV